MSFLSEAIIPTLNMLYISDDESLTAEALAALIGAALLVVYRTKFTKNDLTNL